MADDAFAISPISARASLPSEADYGAIRDAFMETARGRWFLGEYAKRNRNADTELVLDAVARLESGLAARGAAQPSAESVFESVRPLIAEARATAEAAMAASDAADMIAAGRRATRIIREISWSLRETGTDPRICNIFDAQLLALDSVHDHAAADRRAAEISEVFDDLVLRFEEIAGGSAPMASNTPQTPPVKTEPVESVGANLPVAEPEVQVSQPSAMRMPESPATVARAAAPVADDDLQPTPADDDIAADDAVLDLIAMEMSAPDIDDVERDEDAISELRDLAEIAPPPAPMVAPVARVTTPPAAPSSLGAALLANGIVSRPRRNIDALVPFRRMSQIEKIAFFS